jgi:hypothetical protein
MITTGEFSFNYLAPVSDYLATSCIHGPKKFFFLVLMHCLQYPELYSGFWEAEPVPAIQVDLTPTLPWSSLWMGKNSGTCCTGKSPSVSKKLTELIIYMMTIFQISVNHN